MDQLNRLLHDLNGHLSIINSAIYILSKEQLSYQENQVYRDMLDRARINIQCVLVNLSAHFPQEDLINNIIELTDQLENQHSDHIVNKLNPLANELRKLLK